MMPSEITPALAVALTVEIVLLLAGAVVLWRTFFSSAGRQVRQSQLPPWDITGFDFAFAACIVVAIGAVAQVLVVSAWSHLLPELDEDLDLVLRGASFQFGLLMGVLFATLYLRGRMPLPPPPAAPAAPASSQVSAPLAGAATFVAALPVLMLINLPWTYLLERFGVSTDKQELVDLFARAESPILVVLLTVLAVVVAPVAEELLFRAGLFRFLRTRVPRVIAYGLPAVIFGFLHGNVAALGPLVVLGLIFAVAYERTGRISVPIIAHGLFNLNTIALLLVGVPV